MAVIRITIEDSSPVNIAATVEMSEAFPGSNLLATNAQTVAKAIVEQLNAWAKQINDRANQNNIHLV